MQLDMFDEVPWVGFGIEVAPPPLKEPGTLDVVVRALDLKGDWLTQRRLRWEGAACELLPRLGEQVALSYLFGESRRDIARTVGRTHAAAMAHQRQLQKRLHG